MQINIKEWLDSDAGSLSNKVMPSAEPAIIGRVPTPWLEDNWHRISREDFYDQTMSEADLRGKYGETG